MSKIIRMTPEYAAECREAFEKALRIGSKIADGKLSFTKTFDSGDRRAVIHYTPEAWAKQLRVLKEFDKEVAWHGVAYRDEDESKDEYYITDIMVYPQTVTATTVEMDTEEYATWLMNNCDDERFSNIHMQAHSHVNMPTSPSGVDLNHQEEILEMLGDDDFYIFMIWNKSQVSTNKIYDLEKNVMFEDKDIKVDVAGAESLNDFIAEAKSMVKTKTYSYTPPAAGKGSGGGTSYQTGSYQTGSIYQPDNKPYNPLTTTTTTADSKTEKPQEQNKNDDNEKTKSRIGAGWRGYNADQGSFWDEHGGYEDRYPYAR